MARNRTHAEIQEFLDIRVESNRRLADEFLAYSNDPDEPAPRSCRQLSTDFAAKARAFESMRDWYNGGEY